MKNCHSGYREDCRVLRHIIEDLRCMISKENNDTIDFVLSLNNFYFSPTARWNILGRIFVLTYIVLGSIVLPFETLGLYVIG